MTQKSCIAQLLWLAATIFLVAAPVAAQDGDREALGQAAEKAGQFAQALTHYAAALQATTPGSEAQYRLFERAATVASKVRPVPPLPAEAERRFVRGQAAVQSARDVEGFMRAADEFLAAARAAPWFADAYYNLGVVLDKAQHYSQAIRSLKLYMLTGPEAKDAGEAQRLIYQIEFRQEEAARADAKSAAEAAAQIAAKADQQRRLGFLTGRWNGSMTTYFYRINPSMHTARDSVTMEITINGTQVTMTHVGTGRFELLGKVTGSDAASIRWELPPGHAFAGAPVRVHVDPARIFSPRLCGIQTERGSIT